MLIIAPHRVVQVVSLADDAERLVGVVPEDLLVVLAFGDSKAPVLDVDVFVPLLFGLFQTRLGDWDRHAVKFWPGFLADQIQESGRKVRMCGHDVSDFAFRNSRTADDEGNVDVFFEAAFLPRLESVLADMVAVVGRVDDVGVVQDAVFVEAGYDTVNNLVHGLEGTQAVTVKVIVELDVGLILAREGVNPADTAWLRELVNTLAIPLREREFTFLGLKLAFLGTMALGNRSLCLSAGMGGLATI